MANKKKSKKKRKQSSAKNRNVQQINRNSNQVKNKAVYRPDSEKRDGKAKTVSKGKLLRKVKLHETEKTIKLNNKLKRAEKKPTKAKKQTPMRERKRPLHKLMLKVSRIPKKFVAIIVGFVIIALAAGGFTFYHFATAYDIPQAALQEYAGVNEDERDIRDINIGINEQLERAKELKVKGDKKAFKFFVKDKLVFNEWYEESTFSFGSVSTNECVLIVSMLDKDGNLLYRSKGLEANKLIPRIKLFYEIPYGTYDVTLVVAGYDPKTKEMIGVQYTQMSLVIGIEYNPEEETQTTVAEL